MKCEKCGNELTLGENFCRKCGNQVNANLMPSNVAPVDVINPENTVYPDQAERDAAANKLCTISLICYFGAGIIATILTFLTGGDEGIGRMFSSLASLGPLAGIVLMIIARVKYPENKFAKTLMWIYIILAIIGIVLVVVVIIFFVSMCSGLRNL